MTHPFDLHMHSLCSDGTDAPRAVVEKAKAADLSLIALTDHDCLDGVTEAMTAGAELGVRVLPAVEMDTEFPAEVHILGLDVDPTDGNLCAALEKARARRVERNGLILEKLKGLGRDVSGSIHRPMGSVTRLHIAKALVANGHAANVPDAFGRYLRRGCPAFCAVERFTPEEVISLILGAKGVPVWAHPFHAGYNLYRLYERLCAGGLLGVEAYHPSADPGQSTTLVSMARQKDLLVTCGSDSHGDNRQGVTLGCTWRDTAELNEAYAFFMNR